jgi:hypothetical protein
MVIRFSLLSILLLASGCASVAPAPQVISEDGSPAPTNQRAAAKKYLEGRELDPIEGIWSWADDLYQVVITRNNTGVRPEYAYIGILVRSQVPGWKAGRVKLLLNRSAKQDVYDAVYFNSRQVEYSTTFTLSDPDSIETPPVVLYGSSLKVLLVKDYPKKEVSPGQD